jgi:hypothetical protein
LSGAGVSARESRIRQGEDGDPSERSVSLDPHPLGSSGKHERAVVLVAAARVGLVQTDPVCAAEWGARAVAEPGRELRLGIATPVEGDVGGGSG